MMEAHAVHFDSVTGEEACRLNLRDAHRIPQMAGAQLHFQFTAVGQCYLGTVLSWLITVGKFTKIGSFDATVWQLSRHLRQFPGGLPIIDSQKCSDVAPRLSRNIGPQRASIIDSQKCSDVAPLSQTGWH